jgi:hypothetical protein
MRNMEKPMGLPHGQRKILEVIENELRVTDPGLTFVLGAFSSVTRNQGMPPTEQLAYGAD